MYVSVYKKLDFNTKGLNLRKKTIILGNSRKPTPIADGIVPI